MCSRKGVMGTALRKIQAIGWSLAITFAITIPLQAQSSKGKKPDKTPNNDCGGNCFSTQVISAKVTGDCCTEYELKISHDGTCRYDLSHVAFEVPCGTVQNLSNSRNWKQVIGKDPTTGLSGFKIDDVSSFGKDSDSTFTVKVIICGNSACSERIGVVAYKAATCVDYDTLSYNVIGSCGNDDGDNGGDDGGGSGNDSTQTCSTLLATIKIQGTSCYGSSDGSLTASIQDGEEPYTFHWSTGSTSNEIQNLSAGAYYLTITDGDGNILTLSEAVTQPDQIIISESTLNTSCNGLTNGSIDITPSGGHGMYTYLWSTGATTQDLNTIKAGNYSVVVTDSSGCSNQKTFAVVNENKINLTANVTKASCGQATGAINLTINGGVAPYSFVWSNGATTEDVQNLVAENYKVNVTDMGGCSSQATYIVSENNTLRISFTTLSAGCSNEGIGAIDITVTGGTAPYIYSWQNGPTTEDISSLVSGIYRVTVIDNVGCSLLTAINVPKKTIQVSTDIVQPLCYGDSTGSITVTPLDGTTTYTYNWSNGGDSNSIIDVPVGSYTVTITDASGCTRILTYAITHPSAISASTVVSNSQCGAEGGFVIDLSVSGGKTPYAYLWSNGSTAQDVQNLNSGNYAVVITDANGCPSSQNVIVYPVTITWSCLINVPMYDMVCNSVGNILGTSVEGADQYAWMVTSLDNSWAITSLSSNAFIAFTVGNPNTTATFTLRLIKDGCTMSCSYEVTTSCFVRDNTGGGDPNASDPCSSDTVTSVVDSAAILSDPEVVVVNDEFPELNMSVYPNPFENTLNFEWVATKDEIVRLEILDLLGRPLTDVYMGRVQKGEKYKFDWTGSGLKDRMYFYRLTSGNKSICGKMFRK